MKYIIQYLEQDKKFYLNREEELNKSIKDTKKNEYDNNSISIYEIKIKNFLQMGKLKNKSYMKGNYLTKIDISPQIIQI